MRIAVILALLISAIVMVHPVPAQASGGQIDCHGAVPDGHAPADDTGRPQPMAHMCPGCATFAAPQVLPRAAWRAPLPKLGRGELVPRSLALAPVPPPPQPA